MEEKTGKAQALIFNMDGVITQTAKIHKKAWRTIFNAYLKRQENNFKPMDDDDYLRFIKGKPRYKGVESFLRARKIELPFGNENDQPGKQTVCGLGNWKNEIYTTLIQEEGVEIYPDAVEKVKYWKEKGLKTALVTSSKNGELVLKTAGLEGLFDVKVDGVTVKETNLKGKPNHDIFDQAVKQLNVTPQQCVLFEDKVAGVRAGSDGNFALVVGVARNHDQKDLSENGADIVIESFADFDFLNDSELLQHFTNPVPEFGSEVKKIKKALNNRIPFLFLDYDGTLTPIVKRPEDAVISAGMKNVLKECAKKFKVAAVSGRDMDDLKEKVGLDNLIYAGSHGFRISGPEGLYREHEKTKEILPRLDELEKKLTHSFKENFEGVQVERKRYAIAVHYRNAKPEDIKDIKKEVDLVVKNNSWFKVGEGKKIIEIKPDINWHKGKAVKWILGELNAADYSRFVPVYIGDDITDEDAFSEIENDGVGILVGYHESKTKAKYHLKNVYQVRLFLNKLAGY